MAVSCNLGLNRSPANTRSSRGSGTLQDSDTREKEKPPKGFMLQTAHRQFRQKDSLFCRMNLLTSSFRLLGSQGNTPSWDSKSVEVIANRCKRSLISHVAHSSVPMEKPGGNYFRATGYKIHESMLECVYPESWSFFFPVLFSL